MCGAWRRLPEPRTDFGHHEHFDERATFRGCWHLWVCCVLVPLLSLSPFGDVTTTNHRSSFPRKRSLRELTYRIVTFIGNRRLWSISNIRIFFFAGASGVQAHRLRLRRHRWLARMRRQQTMATMGWCHCCLSLKYIVKMIYEFSSLCLSRKLQLIKWSGERTLARARPFYRIHCCYRIVDIK